MHLSLSVPRVEGADLRPWVPPRALSGHQLCPEPRCGQHRCWQAWARQQQCPGLGQRILPDPGHAHSRTDVCHQAASESQPSMAAPAPALIFQNCAGHRDASGWPGLSLYSLCVARQHWKAMRQQVDQTLQNSWPDLRSCTTQVRLQRPTISAEMSFLLAVMKFYIPDFAIASVTPVPFQTQDVLLSGRH